MRRITVHVEDCFKVKKYTSKHTAQHMVHQLPINADDSVCSTRASPGAPVVKNPSAKAGDEGLIPGQEDPLRRKWQPTPTWEIPWTEDPSGHRVAKSQTQFSD